MSQIHSLHRPRRYSLGDFTSYGFDPLVIDWASRVVTNGGAVPSVNTQSALSIFTGALRSASLLSSIYILNPFAPDSLTAAITPLIKTACSDPWTNHNFIASDLSPNGLVGASTKYLDLGTLSKPSSVFGTLTSAGASIYVSSGIDATGNSVLGSASASFADAFGCLANQSGSNYFECWSATSSSGYAQWTPGSVKLGFFSGSRTSAAAISLYFANSTTGISAVNSKSTTSGARPTFNMFSHAFNAGGTPANYTNSNVSFAAVHDGFTLSQTTALYNAVQAYRQAVGGGYV